MSLVILALLVAWCLGLAARNVWTPDEPRELALSASQVGTFTALPMLGGNAFTEKPPLAYWLSGASMDVFGISGAAARAPSLLYAILAMVAIFQLGRRMGARDTGTLAALIFATSWLVFETQIWLATDALLLAAVSLSMLGIYMAVGPRREFLAGCVWMHVGLLLALFTKSFAGWVVPISALFTYLLFERRLRELLHPGFWLPLLGTFGLLALWARDVASGSDGAADLRALFWDNLVGRFAEYGDKSHAVLVLGHPNWPGKYFVELPMYLLPWTPLAVAAVIGLWRTHRRRMPMSAAMRFALCAFVPGLLIISVAATSRGTYAAPLIPGIALLVAVALTAHDEDPQRATTIRRSFRWTVWVLMVTDILFMGAILALDYLHGHGSRGGLVVSLAGIAIVVLIGLGVLRDSASTPAGGEFVESAVVRLAGAHVAALIAISVALFPLLNRSQDLARIAAFLEQSSAGRPLVLWLPDETTLAMSDLYMRKPACTILSDRGTDADHARQLVECLQRYPRAAVVAQESCPTTECGSQLTLVRGEDLMQRRRLAFHDAALKSAGVNPVDGIVRLGGRAYVVGYHVL